MIRLQSLEEFDMGQQVGYGVLIEHPRTYVRIAEEPPARDEGEPAEAFPVTPHPHRKVIADIAFAAAWADGSVCDHEKQALDRIFVHLGYQRSEIMAKIQSAMERPSLDPIDLPDDPSVRLEIMRYALAVTLADGQLAETEVNFLAQLTTHLGISSQTLAILKGEAEILVGDRGGQGNYSLVERVEALLPPENKLKLDPGIEHQPAPREGVSEDTVSSRLALSKLVYQGEEFGEKLDL